MSDDSDLDFDLNDDDLVEGFEIESGLVESSQAREVVEDRLHFYCAGADYKSDDGRKLCEHRAARRWCPPCPGCGCWYDCRRIKRHQRAETRLEMTLADMDKVKRMEYLPTGFDEVDAVLGGGLVAGKVVLFGGRQGGGKTRLLLQICSKFGRAGRRAFFASGEDDRDSVVQFAQGLGLPKSEHVIIHGNEQGLVVDDLIERLRYQKVKLLVVDSAQSIVHSTSKANFRAAEQINRCCMFLTSFARRTKIAVVLIGQLTVENELAGGGTLKHGVDLLVRMDPFPLTDSSGNPVRGGENVRMIWIDGKSRQGSTNNVAYMDMSDGSGTLRPLSPKLLKHTSPRLETALL